VAEDCGHACEERLFLAVEARVLANQEFNNRLSHRQAPGGGHDVLR
jgi:hypothetical protein